MSSSDDAQQRPSQGYMCMRASPLTVSEHRPFIGAHSGKAEPGTILSREF
jgi:hypothetical protein